MPKHAPGTRIAKVVFGASAVTHIARGRILFETRPAQGAMGKLKGLFVTGRGTARVPSLRRDSKR